MKAGGQTPNPGDGGDEGDNYPDDEPGREPDDKPDERQGAFALPDGEP